MTGQYTQRLGRLKVPVVWMVSPGSRGTWFWNILTCAPYLRPGRVCKITDHSVGPLHTCFMLASTCRHIVIKPVMKRYFATVAK